MQHVDSAGCGADARQADSVLGRQCELTLVGYRVDLAAALTRRLSRHALRRPRVAIRFAPPDLALQALRDEPEIPLRTR